MRVKTDRLRVLLIDGHFPHTILPNAQLHQLLSQSLSAFTGREEQHFQPAIFDPQKTGRHARFGFRCDQMRHAANGLRHIFPDAQDLGFGQKMMGRPDRRFPQLYKRLNLFRGACINGVSEDVEDNYQSIVRQLQNPTVAALVLGKASHARELGIQFSLRRDSTMPLHSAYLSSRELVTIVGNLVENAFEAVKAEPLKQVGLFIGEDSHGLTIAVDDTGHGMTEEQIATVRERQYTTKGDGHGFGLRLIQQIVADHRGYLDIESEPGEGSSFTVNFTKKREGAGEC